MLIWVAFCVLLITTKTKSSTEDRLVLHTKGFNLRKQRNLTSKTLKILLIIEFTLRKISKKFVVNKFFEQHAAWLLCNSLNHEIDKLSPIAWLTRHRLSAFSTWFSRFDLRHPHLPVVKCYYKYLYLCIFSSQS